MEIGRTRTPTIISYNASHVTPPANKSTKWFGIKLLCPPDAQKNNKKCLEYGCQVLAIFSVVIVSSLTVHHKYLLYLQSVTIIKGADRGIDKNTRMQQDKGCGKKRRYYYYYYCSKKKKIGAREKRVLAPKNKLQHDL